MTVYELNELTLRLILKGHGNKEIWQGYDCNYAFEDIGKRLVIRDGEIILLSGGYDYEDDKGIYYKDL